MSISPVGLNGRSEIRATYGGLFTALGIICITAQSEIVFMVSGVAWLGASVGRVYSMLLDRNYGIKNFGGIAVETGIGALLVAPPWFAREFAQSDGPVATQFAKPLEQQVRLARNAWA